MERVVSTTLWVLTSRPRVYILLQTSTTFPLLMHDLCINARVMTRVRYRLVKAIMIASSVVVGMTLSIFYSLSIYPNAVVDTMVNQEFLRIDSRKPSRYGDSSAGLAAMKRTSVTIVGVGKTMKRHLLQHLLEEIDILSQDFATSRAIFVIDSSALGMQDLFYEWAKRSPLNRTILTAVAPPLEKEGIFPNSGTIGMPREGRIAHARNIVLQEYAKGPPTEYIIQVDLDIVGWDLGGVRDSFGRSSLWDVACAHGVILYGIYRDAYALRAPGINTNHHLSGLDHTLFNISLSQKEQHRRDLVTSKRKVRHLMEGAQRPSLQRLDSCFGGLAIYRTSAMEGCAYTHRAHVSPRVVDCEHVFFHQCMAERHQARIVSNSHMKVWYGHTYILNTNYLKLFGDWWRS